MDEGPARCLPRASMCKSAGAGGISEWWPRAGVDARLEGFVTRPGEAKQRVVITMKGRPQGVFVLTPLQPGIPEARLRDDEHTATMG